MYKGLVAVAAVVNGYSLKRQGVETRVGGGGVRSDHYIIGTGLEIIERVGRFLISHCGELAAGKDLRVRSANNNVPLAVGSNTCVGLKDELELGLLLSDGELINVNVVLVEVGAVEGLGHVKSIRRLEGVVVLLLRAAEGGKEGSYLIAADRAGDLEIICALGETGAGADNGSVILADAYGAEGLSGGNAVSAADITDEGNVIYALGAVAVIDVIIDIAVLGDSELVVVNVALVTDGADVSLGSTLE